jgi:hypothetical protein
MARGYSGSSDAARVRPPAKVPAYVPVSDDQRADAAWTLDDEPGPAIEATFNSVCDWCSDDIEAGDMIRHHHQYGWVHDDCCTEAEEADDGS